MPKQYEAIRDKLIKSGASRKGSVKSKKDAQKHAAMIYNSKGKGHVGRGSK